MQRVIKQVGLLDSAKQKAESESVTETERERGAYQEQTDSAQVCLSIQETEAHHFNRN